MALQGRPSLLFWRPRISLELSRTFGEDQTALYKKQFRPSVDTNLGVPGRLRATAPPPSKWGSGGGDPTFSRCDKKATYHHVPGDPSLRGSSRIGILPRGLAPRPQESLGRIGLHS